MQISEITNFVEKILSAKEISLFLTQEEGLISAMLFNKIRTNLPYSFFCDEDFCKLGSDNMANIILVSYQRFMLNKPVFLHKQIKSFNNNWFNDTISYYKL